MAVLDYSGMSKAQKLAAFLIVVGAEQAPELLKQLPDMDLVTVVREMAAMEIVDFELQELVVTEFCELVGKGLSTVLGGMPFTQRALEDAKGPHVASNILQKALPASNSIDAVRELSQMESRQIFNLIKAEQPQTIAFILSYLEPKQVAEIVTLFAPQSREEVVERLGSMEAISSELIGKVLKSLAKHLAGTTQKRTLHRRGGVQAAAQLLNSLDKELSKSLLARIEERNAPLGEAIRKKLFSFEDIARLLARDVQRILRDVDTADVAIAMKSARESVRKTVYGAMSKRAAESLREEIELLGPMRVKDVEAAQDRIIAVVRELAEAGEITMPQEGAEDVIN
jgi:flagellar motor switch protein FliG